MANYEQRSPETRAAIAAARRGKKHTAETKKKIGKGVRKDGKNKVPLGTRISRDANSVLRYKADQAGLPLSGALEAAIFAWLPCGHRQALPQGRRGRHRRITGQLPQLAAAP